MTGKYITNSPDETFSLGKNLGGSLAVGDLVLLYGGLGAGKTLLTKGIMAGLGYDVDEVTSPSFALVNLYKTERFDVYHIDLWRLDGGGDPAVAVGLGEILEGENLVIIEWADRLKELPTGRLIVTVEIKGDGDEPRLIEIAQGPEKI